MSVFILEKNKKAFERFHLNTYLVSSHVAVVINGLFSIKWIALFPIEELQ